jgi:sugar/nucleoside kinase (ribokinase family)
MGGRGAIVALTLGRLGAEVDLVTELPATDEANQYLSFLEENGVGTEAVGLDTNAKEFHEVFVAISAIERNCISFFKPGDVCFNASPDQSSIVQASNIAYFSTHKRSFNLSLLEAVDPLATNVIHNVSGYLAQDDTYRAAMLKRSSHLICNNLEAEVLLKAERIERIDELIAQNPGLKTVFVTHGEDGSTVYENGLGTQTFVAHPCPIVAPVGAGDAFAAGIVYGVSREWKTAQTVPFASRLAALSVASSTSYPDLDAVSKLIESKA